MQRRFNCSPEHVFAVLNDGWTYPVWVVGASRMRDVDEGWPTPAPSCTTPSGVWPLVIEDSTEVLEMEPGQRLVLEARSWPVGKARVEARDPLRGMFALCLACMPGTASRPHATWGTARPA